MTKIKELEFLQDKNLTPNPLFFYCLLKIYTNFDPRFNINNLALGIGGLSSSAIHASGWSQYKAAYDAGDELKQLEIAAIVFNDRLKRLAERFNFNFNDPTINHLKLAAIGYVAGEGNIFVNGTKQAGGNFEAYKALNLNELEPYTFLKRGNISPNTGKGWEFAERIAAMYNQLNIIATERVITEVKQPKSYGWLWLLGIFGLGGIAYAVIGDEKPKKRGKKNPDDYSKRYVLERYSNKPKDQIEFKQYDTLNIDRIRMDIQAMLNKQERLNQLWGKAFSGTGHHYYIQLIDRFAKPQKALIFITHKNFYDITDEDIVRALTTENPQTLTNIWHIENRISGQELGYYKGRNEGEALNNFARDAGYRSFNDLAKRLNMTRHKALSELNIRRLAKGETL